MFSVATQGGHRHTGSGAAGASATVRPDGQMAGTPADAGGSGHPNDCAPSAVFGGGPMQWTRSGVNLHGKVAENQHHILDIYGSAVIHITELGLGPDSVPGSSPIEHLTVYNIQQVHRPILIEIKD